MRRIVTGSATAVALVSALVLGAFGISYTITPGDDSVALGAVDSIEAEPTVTATPEAPDEPAAPAPPAPTQTDAPAPTATKAPAQTVVPPAKPAPAPAPAPVPVPVPAPAPAQSSGPVEVAPEAPHTVNDDGETDGTGVDSDGGEHSWGDGDHDRNDTPEWKRGGHRDDGHHSYR